MPTVEGMTADAITTLVNALVQTGAIDESGNLTLTTHDGTVINLGSVATSIPTATTSTAGIVELATSAETITGTDASTAVTPAALASVTSTINTNVGNKQPLDSDLTAIAAIAAADNDIIQHKSGAWTNRTPTQVATDLLALTKFLGATDMYSGSAWAQVSGAIPYIGTVDPSASLTVANGSIWFDTSGS